jgi:hypothetical protein
MPFGFRERLSGDPTGRVPLLSPHAAHTNRRMLFVTSSNPKIPGNIHQLDPLLRSRTAIKIARTPTTALSADQRSSSRVVVMMPPPNSRTVIYYSPGSFIPSSFRERPTPEARFLRRPLLGGWVNRGNLLARVDMFSDSGHVRPRKGRGGKDNERAEPTSACSCEETIRRISNTETQALRGPMRPQAPKRGSRGVYASRRWVCGALPVVRDDRTRKGQRRRCAACAVGADGRRRAITLNPRGAGCLFIHSGRYYAQYPAHCPQPRSPRLIGPGLRGASFR